MNITNIGSLTSNQIITYCQNLQAQPALWVLWVGSIIIYVISLWAVLDMSRVNLTKLLFAGILFSTLSFGLLYFLLNSPFLISGLFGK